MDPDVGPSLGVYFDTQDNSEAEHQVLSHSPKLTVLMPVFNAERYVQQAVQSILGQTYRDFELLILDDASSDHSLGIVRSFHDPRIRIEQNSTNMGVVFTLNRGLELARGELVARMDADDVSLPERFERQIQMLDEHPELVLVGSAFEAIDCSGSVLWVGSLPENDTAIRWHLLFNNCIAHPSVMLRRAILQSAGLCYRPEAPHAEDYQLWSQLLRYGRGRNFRAPLIKYRLHSGQISRAHASQQRATALEISRRNIGRLGVDVSEEDATQIGALVCRFPQALDSRNLQGCRLLLRILRRFAAQPGLDCKTLSGLRQHWAHKVLVALPNSSLRDPELRTLIWDALLTSQRAMLLWVTARGTRALSGG